MNEFTILQDNIQGTGPISGRIENKFSKPTEKISEAIDLAMQADTGFPNVFPKPTQDLIQNAYKTVGYNQDYFSAGILSVAASAIGNTIDLDNGSYISNPILWVSIIGRPGTGKTHPLQTAKKPLEKRDGESFLVFKSLWDEHEQLEKDKRGKKPMYSKFILKDFTPEKLADSLQYSEKGLLIFQDELMRWINSFDQYKKGGDQQMYLDLFNGNGLTVDRITKDPIRIEKTNVNILGGMQPEVLKGMAKNDRSKDGFLDRFLFVYPDNLKPNLFTGLKIEPIYLENYNRLISNLLDAPAQTIIANDVNIEQFKAWQHQKAQESFNDHLETGIQAKLETYVWRLALILEMMNQAATGHYNINLSEKSLNDAIRLVEYFRLNALKVHDRIMIKNPLEELTASQRDLYDSLPKTFKRVDILPLFKEKNMPERSGDRLLKKTIIFDNYKTHKELEYGQYQKKYS